MVKRLEWTPELVERFWSGVAQTSLANLSFSRIAGRNLITVVRRHLRPEGRHLDFGAGDGDLVRILLDQGYATAAYEPTAARREKVRGEFSGRRGFLGVIDGESRERFDVVLAVEVIEHLLAADIDSMLKRLNAFLPRGGTLIVSVPNDENLENSMVYCPVSDTMFHCWQHQRSFSPHSLATLLRGYGFRAKVVHQINLSDSYFQLDFLKKLPVQIIWRPLRWLLLRLYRRRIDQGKGVRILGMGLSTIVFVGEKVAEATADAGLLPVPKTPS